ncbi:MAG TPA: LysM peptidoglycan-binding domain-containing protein [Pararhizobium sp.]|uniref:LysM peptidoglycan-binding domain-containing protein n=1 Tax=Pararhizobium sp. TaxID=1977563 RepID=UPI002B61A309|nr:LysM peptidoglycan-binding domain-containing protein [Pararhizobium sp.]HTO29984.1 LysM peptidoglycan-binding domain-containing protein [Pararhizobium sp.]
MMKNKAGWVALIVLAIASLLMIFVVMPNIQGKKDAETAGTPAQDEAKPAGATADAKGARPTVEGDAAKQAETTPQTATDAKPADAQTADAKPADPTAGWAVPGFDVLRVEPDGSTVIAGRAQPNTKLEIVNGDMVVGTAEVGATGDFAAIFDKPLAAGDYQLTLRSVGENGATKSSEEVATVSIPKDRTGELLAMVSKPGEASRIITKPAGETAEKPTTGEVARTEPAADATAAAIDTAKATDTSAKPADATQTPATQAQAATEGDAATVTPTASGTSAVAVSAVEIEGKKIFVAGNAKAGALVRIYADDALVGEAKADEQGRFVVDGTIDLSVGSHTIRADVMGADGNKVEVRAAVPFDRPAGEQVAAVAQSNAQGTVAPFDGGSFDGLRLEAGKALGLLKGLFADGKVPSVEELAAARSATEIALNSLADFKVADNLDQSVREMAGKTSKAAADALALLKSLPQDADSVSAALGKVETAVGSALMPRTDGTGGNAVATETTTPAPATTTDNAATTVTPTEGQDAEPAPATETAEKPAAGATTPAAQPEAAATATGSGAATATPATGQAAAEPETVQQAPLQQSKTSVIIRRGDTLWQISRRVYGAGVRYTTIYLANEDQITDPDRILPGQIFGVPDKAMSEEESEEMHRKRLKQLP